MLSLVRNLLSVFSQRQFRRTIVHRAIGKEVSHEIDYNNEHKVMFSCSGLYIHQIASQVTTYYNLVLVFSCNKLS
jgi:hypothetical protein